MNDGHVSEGFDWVKARLECSPEKIFQQLKLEVAEDVKSRNAAVLTKREFELASHNGSFAVFAKGRNSGAVTFEKTELGVNVMNDRDTVILSATLTINNSKECRLKVDGQEYESWQFRKMVLEELFFSGPWRAA